MQLKNNQQTVYEEIEEWLAEKVTIEIDETFEEERNRREYRCVEVFDYNPLHQDLPDERDIYIKQVIRCTRKREVWETKSNQWKQGFEQCYYLSTWIHDAKFYQEIIRNHRYIENKDHYVRDWSYAEDKSRIRKNPWAIAILRSFSLNLQRKMWYENITNNRFENSLCLEKLFFRFKNLLT